ncbi:putative cation-transporting ATPase F [Pirellula sp. SH-Sr6A]|uniref:cation-translocating P-type ATPase n=1 Tax=Pirellula sp. SH-Sr6A TaxID=1632865 RepID=UPI00078CFC45|nr:HAD-IC family P-type ATPase [Pirellula sp. SH-Sr6A]AMV33648.1 putative cation-transporting ATPase F [Pirellula sp. SH-Sr6A]
MTNWHKLGHDEVLKVLSTDEKGLGKSEAEKRLKENGPNRLPQQPPTPWWKILLRQFQSPLIYVLVGATILSVALGEDKDAIFVAIVLALNAVIGGYQEWSAEKSSRALQKLLQIRATVTRDGDTTEIDAEELAPGDIVSLESGNRVPADLRLLQATGFEVDESLLTGESLAVVKDSEWLGTDATPMADRRNLAFAASIVVRGRAQGVVVGTGGHTEVGKLAVDVLSSSGGKPPLIERMEKFSTAIAYVVLVSVVAVSLIAIFVHGHTLQEMLLFGVALAVSAIPEGLPAALTVALAVGTTRMAKRGVIVRRLAAVEGLGSCTMIASDKTGTLTCNELTVQRVLAADHASILVTGSGFQPIGEPQIDGKPLDATKYPPLVDLIEAGVLCNEGDLHQNGSDWKWHGDPTDIALLGLAIKSKLNPQTIRDQHPETGAIPFEPEFQFAATAHRIETGTRICVKGAPEKVLRMCAISEQTEAWEHWMHHAEELARQGFRVLAIASGNRPEESIDLDPQRPPQGLAFLGFIGMIDPLRPGVKQAVEQCQLAGITVCMVTGDHPVTALAISKDLGMADSPASVVAGQSLNGLSQEELREMIRTKRVFARVTPRQKLELVNAARAEGHFVAVTGDGVNDAPALRASNIGIAMGKSGTDVAREAAELVISDDNFATIIAGVEEGRIAYDNIRKVIYLLVSMGFAEVLLIGATFVMGAYLPIPFLPVQLLWLNLVTDGIQGVALAFEPGEQGVLRRKPRSPSEPIFDRLMLERIIIAAITMMVVGTGAFWWMIQAGWSEASARNALLLLTVLFQNIHIGNCRSETKSGLRQSPLKTPFLFAGAIGALGIHIFAMHFPPLQAVLRIEPVSWQVWGAMFALSLTAFVTIEIHKWTWWLRYGDER